METSITDGLVLAWQEDDSGCYDRERLNQAYKRLTGIEFKESEATDKEDHGDWIGYSMPNGWVAAYSPMGSEIYKPKEK